MLKIGFMSDLHIDHHSGILPNILKLLENIKLDVLLIAGDLVTGSSRVKAALSPMSNLVKTLCFLPGNHELWLAPYHVHLDSKKLYEDILPKQTRSGGGVYLGKRPFYIKEKSLAIVGVTGWCEGYPNENSPDKKMVRFPNMNEPEEIVNWMSNLLKNQLDEASKKAEKIIVVTHLLPSPQKFKRIVDPKILPYLGSPKLGDVILSYNKVKYVISGHLHMKYEGFIDDNKKIPWDINAFGYPEEIPNLEAAFNDAIHIIQVD